MIQFSLAEIRGSNQLEHQEATKAAISTTENNAMAAAFQETLYLGSLLDEMDVVIDGPAVIKEDNQSKNQDVQEPGLTSIEEKCLSYNFHI